VGSRTGAKSSPISGWFSARTGDPSRVFSSLFICVLVCAWKTYSLAWHPGGCRRIRFVAYTTSTPSGCTVAAKPNSRATFACSTPSKISERPRAFATSGSRAIKRQPRPRPFMPEGLKPELEGETRMEHLLQKGLRQCRDRAKPQWINDQSMPLSRWTLDIGYSGFASDARDHRKA